MEAPVPFGHYFMDDPKVYTLPGSGFKVGPEPPPDCLHVAPLYSQATVDTLRAQLEAAEAEVERWHQQSELHKHMVITCGVAATHSDPNLTLTGAYKEKWNSQQAESVRALRARAEAAEADAARYQLLKVWGRQMSIEGTGECNFGITTPTWRGPWIDLDAAIDAAIARTKDQQA